MKWDEYYLLLAIVVVFLIIVGAVVYRNEKFEKVRDKKLVGDIPEECRDCAHSACNQVPNFCDGGPMGDGCFDCYVRCSNYLCP